MTPEAVSTSRCGIPVEGWPDGSAVGVKVSRRPMSGIFQPRLPEFTGLLARALRSYHGRVEHRVQSGPEREIWVMVDQDGERTLFRLVEVEDPGVALRLSSDPRLPVVMIDAVVPPTGPNEATAGAGPEPPRPTLIVVNLRRANDAKAAGFVAYKSRAAERIGTIEWHMPPAGEEQDR